MESKVLSFQMAEDSATIDCGPSYIMQYIAQSDPLLASNLTQFQILFAEAALARKWIVVVPDYESETCAFGAGSQSGYAFLDSIRAALAFEPIGLPKDEGGMYQAKIAWWDSRKQLDQRMKDLVENIEFCWLGAFKVRVL